MRITLESDYALRIVTSLAKREEQIDAKTIADETQVSSKFALKILHKLVQGGIVESFKGKNGGYKLRRSASEITLKEVIELIEGPIELARCLGSAETCTMISDKSACTYHHIFHSISLELAKKLSGITIEDVITMNYTL